MTDGAPWPLYFESKWEIKSTSHDGNIAIGKREGRVFDLINQHSAEKLVDFQSIKFRCRYNDLCVIYYPAGKCFEYDYWDEGSEKIVSGQWFNPILPDRRCKHCGTEIKFLRPRVYCHVDTNDIMCAITIAEPAKES